MTLAGIRSFIVCKGAVFTRMMNLLSHCLQPRLDPDVHFYKPEKRGGIPTKVDMRISPPEQYGEWSMEQPSPPTSL